MVEKVSAAYELPDERIMKLRDPIHYSVNDVDKNGSINTRVVLLTEERHKIIQSIMMRIVCDELIKFTEKDGIISGELKIERP